MTQRWRSLTVLGDATTAEAAAGEARGLIAATFADDPQGLAGQLAVDAPQAGGVRQIALSAWETHFNPLDTPAALIRARCYRLADLLIRLHQRCAASHTVACHEETVEDYRAGFSWERYCSQVAPWLAIIPTADLAAQGGGAWRQPLARKFASWPDHSVLLRPVGGGTIAIMLGECPVQMDMGEDLQPAAGWTRLK